MLEFVPPRREPRLLVLVLGTQRVAYAAVDPWEVRALGCLPTERRVAPLTLWRVFARVRPSHVTLVVDTDARQRSIVRLARQFAVRGGLPLGVVDRRESVTLAAKAPKHAELLRAYPELRHLVRGPRDPALRAVRIALGVLVTRSLPPRRYVPRISPRSASVVDA